MSLEESILKLVAAVEANTAAHLGGAAAPAAAPAATKSTKAAKTETAAPAPAAPAAAAVDRSMVNAALEKVKEDKGVEAAKSIIKESGKATKRADIKDEDLQAVYDACKAALEDEGL